MKKAVYIFLLSAIGIFYATVSFADIGIDATSTASGNTTSLSFAHVVSGSDTILLCGVGDLNGTSDTITGVTYNGVAMTRADGHVNLGSIAVYLYYLIAPDSGSHNVIISSSATHNLRGSCASYTGTNQSTFPDSVNFGNKSPGTSPLTVTTTSTTSGTWLVGVSINDGGSQAAGTGTFLRVDTGTTGAFWDSNGIVSTGLQSLEMTWSGSEDVIMIVAALSPTEIAPSSSPSSTLEFQTETCVTNASGTQCYDAKDVYLFYLIDLVFVAAGIATPMIFLKTFS